MRLAGGDPPAAGDGHEAARGAAGHREREEGRRLGAPRPVPVEERRPVQPGPGGHLGHGRVGGGGGHAARATAVEELHLGVLPHRGERGPAAPHQVVVRVALHQPDREATERLPRRGVAEAGDLRVVRHQPHQPKPAAGRDLPCHLARGGGRVHGRAAHADVQAQRAPGAVEVEADPDLGTVARRRDGVDDVELRGPVHHEGDRRGQAGVRGELAQGGAVRGRVCHQRVVRQPGADQPDGLGQRERHHAAPARGGERALEEGAAADGLAGNAEGLSGGPADERGGVRIERSKIDDRERRVEVRGGLVQAFAERVACGRRHTSTLAVLRWKAKLLRV